MDYEYKTIIYVLSEEDISDAEMHDCLELLDLSDRITEFGKDGWQLKKIDAMPLITAKVDGSRSKNEMHVASVLYTIILEREIPI